MPRPIPSGRHHAFDDPDRIAWRENHRGLIEALEMYSGTNEFFCSLADSLAHYGWLTERQQESAYRFVNEGGTTVAEPPRQSYADAGADDCVEILNGTYTISNDGEHLTYKIHTVQRGPLQGKRIIKFQAEYQGFSGFAFLTASGHVKVWRRFLDQEGRNERYIVWAKHLLQILRDEVGTNDITEAQTIDGVLYRVQRTVACRRCNRELTNPSSIDAGLGQECAGHVHGTRSQRAATHEPVAPPVPLVDIINGVPVVRVDDLRADEDANVDLTPYAGEQVDLDDDDSPRVILVSHGSNAAAETPMPYPTERMLTEARERLRRIAALGNDTTEAQAAWQALYQRLNFTDRSRTCTYCGRMMVSHRGLARHRGGCAGRLADAGQPAAPRMARVRQPAHDFTANPNLSALGTRFAGAVWEQ